MVDMKNHWLLLIMLFSILTSCGKQIPGDILKPRQMEEVLYDYHLTMGMFSNQHTIENPQRNALKQYVFNKHGITAAEFDSSMVWYTREADELCTIYENLEKRFKREHNHAESLLANRNEENSIITSYGDTIDIWRKREIYWMSNSQLNNQMTFEFKADTNFHARDAFRWNLDIHFLAEGELTLGMNIIYDNDSIIGKTQRINKSGNQVLYLHTDSTWKIKKMNGFIHVSEDTLKRPKILIKDISLMRYHKQEKDTLNMDSKANP